jgi:hypothetical protein
MVWTLLLSLLGCQCDAVSPDLLAVEVPTTTQISSWKVLLPAERSPNWSGALCNDGTPAGLSVRHAVLPSRTWVVHLQGGFFCDDVGVPCKQRAGRLITGPREEGRRLPDGATWLGPDLGLLAQDADKNPVFHDANHVVLHYCSSDFWLGEHTERLPVSGSPQGWFFSGRHVLRAQLQALSTVGFDATHAETQVLMVGSSAGGVGLVANLDLLQEVWPNATSEGRVKALIDGGWIPEVDLSVAPRGDRWGTPLKACVADQLASGEDALRCALGPVWYPYWHTSTVPLLVQQSGVDQSQARIYGLNTGEKRARWRVRLRDSLRPVSWVFSGGSTYHTLAADPRSFAGPPGQRFVDVVGRFWAGEPPEQVFVRYDSAP